MTVPKPKSSLWPASQIESRPLAKLIPYARNAKVHPSAQVVQIAASIREWGWTMPLLVDEADVLLAGHGRVLAGQLLELETAPVIVARGWDEAKKRAYRIADNKLTENASWDNVMLGIELEALAADPELLELTGFSELELASLAAPETDPEAEWKGMPEFHQPDAGSWHQLIVHFKGAEEMAAFAELVGQPVNQKTRSLWYPEAEIGVYRDKRYVADPPADAEPSRTHKQGGNVPGGHLVLQNPGKPPFVPDMKACNAVPLRHSDVVVDIGAFVGTYAIRAARFPVRRVIAYEPTPRSFSVMAATQLVNLEQHQAAVAATSGETNFYLSSGIGVRNSLMPSDRKAPITVPTIAYVDAVRDATVVKIDIEGGEYGIPIVQPNLRAIILEFHKVTRLNWRDRAEQIIADIEAAGFRRIIESNWNTGFSWSFTWLRDRPDDGTGHAALLAGELCCGCSAAIVPAGRKAVCSTCWPHWARRHRGGFVEAERLADPVLA